MGNTGINTRELYVLKNEINNGKKVILVDLMDSDIIKLLLMRIREKNCEYVNIWHCIDFKSVDSHLNCLPQSKMDIILEIYRTYDFSDKVFVISDSDEYGSLFNYVKTGILTKREMVDSLLYKI